MLASIQHLALDIVYVTGTAQGPATPFADFVVFMFVYAVTLMPLHPCVYPSWLSLGFFHHLTGAAGKFGINS